MSTTMKVGARDSLLLVVIAGLFSKAAAQDPVTWQIPMNPQTKTVAVGTEVEFTWTGTHNVYESASKADFDNCVLTGGTMVGDTSGTKVTMSSAGTRYFICEVGSHCANNQKLAITATDDDDDDDDDDDATTTDDGTTGATGTSTTGGTSTSMPAPQDSVTWKIPMDPQAKTVAVGTEIEFTWTGNHNVYESASKADFDNCVLTGGTMVGTTSGAKVTMSNAGTRYFICEVAGHCTAKQKLAITATAIGSSSTTDEGATGAGIVGGAICNSLSIFSFLIPVCVALVLV